MSQSWKLKNTLLATNNLHRNVKILYWFFPSQIPAWKQASNEKWKSESFGGLGPRSQGYYCDTGKDMNPRLLHSFDWNLQVLTCRVQEMFLQEDPCQEDIKE